LIIIEKNYIIIKRGSDINSMVTFFERLGAYLVDLIIVGLLLMIVEAGLPSSNVEEINNQLTEIEEKYKSNEIATNEYFKEYYGLMYELQNSSKLSSFVSLIITIGYFVVFQTLYNGQTLGKKLLKLQIVDVNTKKSIGMFRMFLRSLFTLSIVSSSCNLLMLLLFSKDVYIIGYLLISSFEVLFIIIVIIMILYRVDKRGLHDLISKTCVIKEGGGY